MDDEWDEWADFVQNDDMETEPTSQPVASQGYTVVEPTGSCTSQPTTTQYTSSIHVPIMRLARHPGSECPVCGLPDDYRDVKTSVRNKIIEMFSMDSTNENVIVNAVQSYLERTLCPEVLNYTGVIPTKNNVRDHIFNCNPPEIVLLFVAKQVSFDALLEVRNDQSLEPKTRATLTSTCMKNVLSAAKDWKAHCAEVSITHVSDEPGSSQRALLHPNW